MGSYIKFYIGLTLSIFLTRGGIDVVVNKIENKCEMTYMFEYPQYIKINLPNSNSSSINKYGLYIYGEGYYAEELSKGKFDGIPVLFIPGNQGSYKQVRSLGSVAYRKAIDEKLPFHFNFFSVDFNEEIGAFFGPVLDSQTQFVSIAIRRILSLYARAAVKPTSVILVGHSMGGIIARAVMTLPEIPASSIPLIISQATPHMFPVISPDHRIENFYKTVNYHWEKERFVDFRNLVLISIGAGINDFQVPNHYTSTRFADVDASTLAVPSCWLTTDHLAIVWCKQLVLATVRALVDSIDKGTKAIATDRNYIIEAFKYQLVQRSGPRHGYPMTYESELSELDRNGHWMEISRRQLQHELKRPIRNSFLMIPIRTKNDNYQHVTVVGKELDWNDWIFACKDDVLYNNTRMCSRGENLSQNGRIIPGDKKEINVKTAPLIEKGFTHVVVYVKPSSDKVQVALDMSDFNTRRSSVSAPKFMSPMTVETISKATPANALSFNITIKEFYAPWQSLVLKVIPTNQECVEKGFAKPQVSMVSSWGQRWSYVFSDKDTWFDHSLEIDVPVKPDWEKPPYIKVHILINQKCTYKITMENNYRGIFMRLALLYGAHIPSFVLCHFVLILANQLKGLALNQKSSSVFSSVLLLTPMVVVPFVKLLSYGLSNYSVIESDFHIMSMQGIDMGVLPIFLFLCSLPLSFVISFVMWIMVIAAGNATHNIAIKFLKRTIRSGDILMQIAVAGFWKVPVIAAVALVAIAFGSNGSLALVISAAIYFIKVFKLYEDYLETFLISLVPGIRHKCIEEREWQLSSVHIHFTLLIISILTAVFNLPTLISWAKALSIGGNITMDPSLPAAVVVLIAQGILWQIKTIDHQRAYYKELGYIIHAGAVSIILFGSINVYRNSYIVAFLMLLIALHQLFAPESKQVISAETLDSSTDETNNTEDQPKSPEGETMDANKDKFSSKDVVENDPPSASNLSKASEDESENISPSHSSH